MYEDLTPEYIKADILGDIELADTREGSYTNTLVSPVAYEIWKAYKALNSVIPMVYIDETSGPFIDIKAGGYGIRRKPGKNASANVRFIGEAGVVIPSGKVFLTADSLQYTLEDEAVIIGGVADGVLTAAETGEKYNVPAGAISRQLINTVGLEQVISEAAEGGTDTETDAAYVKRYYDYLRRPATSGNTAHYLQWAKEVDGINDAKVIPLWNGNGTVKVLIVGARNQPVDESIVTNAFEHIESVRPIGADVTVESAAGKQINVSAAVVLRPSADIVTVGEAFTQALGAYLERIAFDEYIVVYNRIGYILLDTHGVVDFTSLLVNGGMVDIAISGNEVPVIGNIEVA